MIAKNEDSITTNSYCIAHLPNNLGKCANTTFYERNDENEGICYKQLNIDRLYLEKSEGVLNLETTTLSLWQDLTPVPEKEDMVYRQNKNNNEGEIKTKTRKISTATNSKRK